MLTIVAFFLSSLTQIAAVTTRNHNYVTMQNKQTSLHVMVVTDARSSIECAVHCTVTEGCSRAQYKESSCELLSESAVGDDFELGTAENT